MPIRWNTAPRPSARDRPDPSFRIPELQPHNTGEYQDQAGDSPDGHGFPEQNDSGNHRPDGTDPGPDGISGTQRDRPHRGSQKKQTRSHRDDRHDAGPKLREAVGVLESRPQLISNRAAISR